MNNLYQQLQPNKIPPLPANMNQIKGIMNMLKGAKNPQAMFQSMLSQNPQMKQVVDLVQQSGGDPKAVFYKLAEQQGVNPDDVLNALK